MTKMSVSHRSIRWAFNINNWKPTFEQWKLAVQCVQKEEVERCYRFHFIEDCKTSLVGQLLMRKVVNECMDLPYDKIIFSRSSSGKPYLEKNEEHFFFNVSHHGDFCVLAAERNLNVGIDVMKVEHRGTRPVTEFFTTMRKQFSSYEWNFITQPGLEKEQLRRFYRLWCLKESYVKAIGTGIVYDLQSISFSCPTSVSHQGVITVDSKLYENGQLQPQWKFEETFLDDSHCVAVATEPIPQNASEGLGRPGDQPKTFHFLGFTELMQNCKPFEKLDENFWKGFISKEEKRF